MSTEEGQHLVVADWKAIHSFQHLGSSCVFDLSGLNYASVRWNLKLIDWIREEIARTSDDAGTVVNANGLLLGKVEAAPNRLRSGSELQISWFLPLPARLGSSGEWLTPDALAAVSNRIASAKERNLEVVGVYCTHSNAPRELEPADRRFCKQFISDPAHILLVIEQGETPSGTAAIYFPCGRGRSSAAALTFPFDRDTLSRVEQEAPLEETQTPANLSNWYRAGILVLIIVLISAVGISYYPKKGAARDPIKAETVTIHSGQHPTIRLLAAPENGRIRLSWDSRSTLFNSALGGLLKIEDGTFTNTVYLTRAALHEGSIVYNPLSKHVKLKLQVGQEFGEISLVNDLAATNAAAQPAPPPRVPASDPPRQDDVRASAIAPAQVPVSPAPPEAAPLAVAPLPAPPALLETTIAPKPRVSDIVPSSRVPSSPPPIVTEYVAPDAEKRVFPNLPANISRLVTSLLVIHVTVQIDAQGTVTKAEPEEHGNPVTNYLADASKQAALKWHFTPAQRDNVHVASQTVLEFRYSPPR